MTATHDASRLARLVAGGVIDADLNLVVPSPDALLPYLSDYWREQAAQTAFKGPVDVVYPAGFDTTARPGSKPASGPAGSDLALLREQALDPWNTQVGILTCAYAIESIHNPDGAAAWASAANDWIIGEWLEKEPRLRGSIVVPAQQPELAAREIDRVGGHPGFVQVYLPVRAEAPYGNRRYTPIFEAAARHDLAIGIGFGGAPPNPPTPSGWPSYYLEEWAGMASIFQSQLMSLIVEGVFERFPTLRVALIEGGFTWLPSLMWRWDKEWKGLRPQTPWVRRLPSAYIHEHVRLTTQPWDAPPSEAQFLQLIDQLGSDELLMFSTDYPHWQYDAPEEALPPAGLPEALVAKIMRGNAQAFYRL
jgi:uncharacterized protein